LLLRGSVAVVGGQLLLWGQWLLWGVSCSVTDEGGSAQKTTDGGRRES